EGDILVTTATSVREAEGIMSSLPFDAVVSDYQMPGQDGLEFLERLRSAGNGIPFVLFTGKGREEVAIRALNHGADRYVQKGGDIRSQFAEAMHAVRTAVEQRRSAEALRNREDRLAAIFRAAPTGIGVVSNRILMEVNDRLCEMTGYGRSDLVGRSARVLYPTDEDFNFVGTVKYALISRYGTGSVETKWQCKDGRTIDIILSSTPIEPTDLAKGVVFTALDITAHKHDLLHLKDSEERWKFALEGSGDGVFDWNVKEDRVYFSPRWKLIIGYQDEELRNDSHEWRSRIHPEDKERVMAALEAHLRGETAEYEVEYRLRCKDGSYKWVLARGLVIERSEGRPLRMLGTHSDISRRKAAEDQRMASERRFSSVFQGMNEGMALHEIIYDGQGRAENYRLLEVNRRYEEILGLRAENILGRLANEVYGTERPPFVEEFCEADLTGHAKELDVYFGPMAKHFHISVVPLEKGRFATIFTDTSNQRTMEKDLKDREAYLRLLTDNMEDMITQASADNRVVYISPSVTRRLGYTQSGLLGREIAENVHPEDVERVRRQFRAALASKERTVRLEYRYLASSEDFVWVESETHLFYTETGGYDGCIFVSRDIADRKLAESAAALANNKLQLLNSVTRHDILNQVTILRGYLEMDAKVSDDPRMVEHLARMRQAVVNIQSQIDFMRDYQRMGEFAPDWQEVESIFGSVAKAFHLDRIRFEVDLPRLEVFADRLLEKVFHNLIDNSLRHGGRVSSLSLRSEREDGAMLLVYSDDGVGIKAEDKSRIFEMGYGRNTGYGLFLAKEILELTGLEMEERGEPGQGAKFVIRAPKGTWRVRA
ncbi:MAG: PAS domain S-box protein, partial [Methanomassiliicoccales archaeon]|nr:PAS domain S-box protein [Methanomassiliicoccales archaeon]